MVEKQKIKSINEDKEPETKTTVTIANKVQVSFGFLATIVSIFPILGSLGFLIAFLHEIGYASAFHFPIELIKLDTATILKYIAISLFLLILYGLESAIIALKQYNVKNYQRGKFWVFIAWANFIFTPVFIFADFKQYFGHYSSYITAGLLILQMVLFIPMNLKKKDETKITKKIVSVTKDWPTWIIGIMFAVASLSFLSGLMDSQFEKTYLVPSTNPDSIVLRIYGDTLLCAPLASDMTIKRSYFILKIDQPNLVLSERKFKTPLFPELEK